LYNCGEKIRHTKQSSLLAEIALAQKKLSVDKGDFRAVISWRLDGLGAYNRRAKQRTNQEQYNFVTTITVYEMEDSF
jgi:hypothetical protein